MGGFMNFITGSGSAAQQSQGYSDHAADESSAAYDQAMKDAAAGYKTSEGQLLNAQGSPSANMFIKDQNAVLMPTDANIMRQLQTGLAGSGIGSTARGSQPNFSGLAQDQGASLASVTAPMYKTGIAAYDSLVDSGASTMSGLQGAKAAGKSGIWGQGATSASDAYTNAMDSFYKAAQTAGQAYGGSGGGGAPQSGGYGGWDPDGTTAMGAIQNQQNGGYTP